MFHLCWKKKGEKEREWTCVWVCSEHPLSPDSAGGFRAGWVVLSTCLHHATVSRVATLHYFFSMLVCVCVLQVDGWGGGWAICQAIWVCRGSALSAWGKVNMSETHTNTQVNTEPRCCCWWHHLINPLHPHGGREGMNSQRLKMYYLAIRSMTCYSMHNIKTIFSLTVMHKSTL